MTCEHAAPASSSPAGCAAFFDAAPGLLAVISPEGTVLRAGRNLARTLGREPADMEGRPVTDFLVELSCAAVDRARDEMAYGMMAAPLPMTCRRADGSICTLSILGAAGGDGNFHIVGHEVRERRADMAGDAVDAQMRQAQKLEAIGTLASGVAHEINNPLNSILNYAQLIIDDALPGTDAGEFATEIITESNRLARLVRNLLTFARTDTGEMTPARPADVLESALSLTRASMRRDMITLEEHVAPGLPDIWCRSQQVQQVILNLVLNARDAVNEKYPARDPAKRITVTLEPALRDGADWVIITVADQGAGVPAELAERIFDPFFSTKPAGVGTGLGLSISYGIVRDHDGTLTLEPNPAGGAIFRVGLPAAPRGAPAE